MFSCEIKHNFRHRSFKIYLKIVFSYDFSTLKAATRTTKFKRWNQAFVFSHRRRSPANARCYISKYIVLRYRKLTWFELVFFSWQRSKSTQTHIYTFEIISVDFERIRTRTSWMHTCVFDFHWYLDIRHLVYELQGHATFLCQLILTVGLWPDIDTTTTADCLWYISFFDII